jgi:hypothetical protein
MSESLGPLDDLTLKQLQAAGSNLAKSTEVVNYLYFHKEKDALKATSKLTDGGYTVKGPSRTSEGYLVVARSYFVPNAENIASLRRVMESIAGECHGDYDGWEAAVNP